jgi:hypothetical protein
MAFIYNKKFAYVKNAFEDYAYKCEGHQEAMLVIDRQKVGKLEKELDKLERKLLEISTDDPLVIYQQLRILLLPQLNPWSKNDDTPIHAILDNAWSLAVLDFNCSESQEWRWQIGIRSPQPNWPVGLQ